MPLDLDAIRRRWATTTWTNGRTPELADDIAALLSELDRLHSELAAAQPVVEWRQMLDGRTGEVTTHAAEVGVAALRVAEKQWRARSFPGWKGEKPGWAVVFGMKYVAASGPETGPAGKSAAEAAYRRACGFPTAPPCAG